MGINFAGNGTGNSSRSNTLSQAAAAVRAAKASQYSGPTNTNPDIMGGARDYGGYPAASGSGGLGPGTPADTSGVSNQLQNALAQMQGAGSGAGGGGGFSGGGSAGAQYDAQIAALQQALATAKHNAGTATKDTKGLYNDYQNFLKTDTAPAIASNAKSSKAASVNTSNSLKQAITQDYSNRLKDQVNMYKQLGIQSAGGTSLQGQQNDQQTALDNAAAMGDTSQQALNVEHQADVGYLNASKAIGKNESANAITDIAKKLLDYQNATNTSIAGLQGQRASAMQAAVARMQSAGAGSARQAQNDTWSKMMDLARLKLAAQKGGGVGGSMPTSGLSGAVGYLGDQGYANDFQSLLQEASTWKNSPDARNIYGHVPTGADEMANVILNGSQNRNLPQPEQMKLWQAALKYYGKG